MGLWRDILRVLGLTNDARVHISAPGIDVVITGDPDQVRQLLGVVKHELERSATRRELAEGRRKAAGTSQVVRPSELDEMDSPYVLPEAMVLPVDETTGELLRTPVEESTVDQPKRREVRVTRASDDDLPTTELKAKPAAHEDFDAMPEAATLLPDIEETPPAEPSVKNGIKDPSGPAFVPDSEQPFVTDGGPTLAPADSSGDLSGTDPEVEELKPGTQDKKPGRTDL